MSAHVSSFGITFSPNERIIYRDFNNEPTTKERARFVVLQRFYDDGLLKEEIIEDLKPRTREDMIPRNGVMTQIERVCARRTSDEPEPQPRLGCLRMLDPAYQRHVSGESNETYKRIPCGFREMIESAFPNGENGNLTTEHEKSRVRGMGFVAMLEGARSGTE
jgi:hypothetical protein